MASGEEIHRSISAGTYTCVLCLDNVDRQSHVWHCSSCFHTYHYQCLLSRAGKTPNSDNYGIPVNYHRPWKCPTCAEIYTGVPKRSCWCGNSQTPPPHIAGRPPFSCGHICGQLMECGHHCYQKCHAGTHGPCHEQHVVESCFCGMMKTWVRCGHEPSLVCCGLSTCNPAIVSPSSQPVHFTRTETRHATSVRRDVAIDYAGTSRPTNWSQGHRISSVIRSLRDVTVSKKVIGSITFTLALIAAIYGFALALLEPHKHRYIAENRPAGIATSLGIFILSLITAITNAVSIECWVMFIKSILDKIRSNFRRVPYGLITIAHILYVVFVLTLGFSFVFAAAMWVVGPMVIPYIVPGLVRKQAFAHICDGMDTQIFIDGPNYMYPLFRNLDHSNPSPLPDYSMAITHATLTLDSYKTSAHNESIITEYLGFDRINYDFDNGIWYTTLSATPVTNGTFLLDTHLVFPSLNLQIPNFSDYIRKCVYEPYLKVHHGSGDLREVERQAKEGLTEDHGDLVMRTASFGWQQGELQICAQRADEVGNGVVRRGLGREVPVVAGLMAVVRQKGTVEENEGRGTC